MKNKLQNQREKIIDYMNNWVDLDKWDALDCMLNAALVRCPDALEYAADYLMSSGVINSKTCYKDAQSFEQDIELLAKKYRKMSKKRKDLVYKHILDGVLIVDCQDCNHVCFVHSNNEQIYPEVRHRCWQCKSENLNIKRIK